VTTLQDKSKIVPRLLRFLSCHDSIRIMPYGPPAVDRIRFPDTLRILAMRLPTACFTAAIIAAGLSLAHAQAPKSTTTVRYFASLGDILGDLPVDAFIKETRQGGKVVSAVLDACYSVSPTSDHKDRFAIELKPDGQKFTGTGTSLEDKQPVTVSLTRKPSGDTVSFDGKITVGGKASLVSSAENSESDENEFEQSQTADDDLVGAPTNFTEVSPQSVAVQVKRDAFVDLVKSLKSEPVRISLDSLATDCTVLRTGEQTLRLTVDPARAPALIAKLKTAPGVIAAGWATGTYEMERAIRIPAAEWRDGSALNKDKFAAALSDAAAKAMGGKALPPKWNDTTGELTLSAARPSTLAPALGFTETLEMTVLVGPERPGVSDRLIVWLGVPSSTTKDDATGSRLEFTEPDNSDDEGSFTEDNGVIQSVAEALKGQRWDSDKSLWK
jgi:hypothetical protein